MLAASSVSRSSGGMGTSMGTGMGTGIGTGIGKWMTDTMWKFQDFSVIYVYTLCEINFGESKSSKTAVLANSGAQIFLI